ncbi:hypothetical protein GCM10027168_03720 [Streptomyces capparidis]
MSDLLERLERYYDAVPRAAARAEDIGPLVLFVREGAGWPYYARPRPDAAGPVTAGDIAAVRLRQRALGLPEAFEWVEETAPSMAAAARGAGLAVHLHPLLVLDRDAFAPVPAPAPFRVRRVTADDTGLPAAQAVAAVAFAHRGTLPGAAGERERDLAALGLPPGSVDALRERLRSGRTVMYAAHGPQGPVAVGSHQQVGDVSEVVGVGTLPAARREGLAAAVTSALAGDALARGAGLVFLSADGEAVARVYARLGFRRAATAGIAD